MNVPSHLDPVLLKDLIKGEYNALEISLREGNPERSEYEGTLIEYIVSAETERGKKFDIGEAIIMLCEAENIHPGMLAAVITARLKTAQEALATKGL